MSLPVGLDLELIYVGDPMCSWCWGFAPVLDELESHYETSLATIVGGLRPGDAAQPLDERLRGFLSHEWQRIAATTGQPFSEASLQREAWIYDTELPAIAVTTMREHEPASTLTFFSRLQRAFYAEGTDITDLSAYHDLVDGFGVDPVAFVAEIGTAEARQRAWADFASARRLGVGGFPTLLLRIGEEMAVVTRGYMPFEQIEPPLSAWITAREAESA
jgi:putative protein-disulfide isomerase